MARPALVIGLGGTGQWVLTYVKKELLEYSNGNFPKEVRLVCFDTARPLESNKRKPGEEELLDKGGVRLEPGEFHHLGGNFASIVHDIVKDETAHEHIGSWLQAKTYLNRLGVGQYVLEEGAGQMRPIGRMAVFKDLETGPESSRIFRSLRDAIDNIRSEIKENRLLEIFIVASLAGGTGAGMSVDIAHITRTIAEASIGANFVIRGFFALPSAYKTIGGDDTNMRARAFAALREFSRFLTNFGDRAFPMVYNPHTALPDVNKPLEKRVFDLCYILDANRERNPLDNVPAKYGVFPSIADGILTFIDEKSGQAHTEHVKNVFKDFNKGDDVAYFSTLGTYTYKLPIHDIVEEHACNLALDYLVKVAKPEFDGEGRPIRLSNLDNLEAEGKTGGDMVDAFMLDPSTGEGMMGTHFLQEVSKILERGGVRAKLLVEQFANRGYNDLLPVIEPDEAVKEFRELRLEVRTILSDNKLRQAVKSSRELKRKPNLDIERVEKDVEAYQNKFLGRKTADGRTMGGKFREALDRHESFQASRYRVCLAARCEWFLNGTSLEDPQRAKGGKLGFTLDFLKTLQKRMDRFNQFLRKVKEARAYEDRLQLKREEVEAARNQMYWDKDKAGIWSKAGVTSQETFLAQSEELIELEKDELLSTYVERITRAMLDDTTKTLEALESWIRLLILGSPRHESVFSVLHAVKERIRARREHGKLFSNVRVEKTDEEYEQTLYHQYAKNQPQDMFKQTSWKMDPESTSFSLTLSQKVLILENHDRDNPAEHNARCLLEIARSVFKSLPEKNSIGARLMNVDPDELAEELYRNGSPLIRYNNRPKFAKTSNYLTVKHGIREGDQPYFHEVLKALGNRAGARGDMAQLVQSEGSNKCTLVYAEDFLDLPSCSIYDYLLRAYLEYGDDRRLLHCFPAEVNAAYYEQRIAEHFKRPYQILHPRITAFLEYQDWFRQFVRCMAYGLIAKAKDEEGYPYYVLNLSKTNHTRKKYLEPYIELSMHDRTKPDLMQAMQTFVFLRKDFRKDREIPINYHNLTEALTKAKEDTGNLADNIEKIERFINKSLERKLGDLADAIRQDLMDLMHIILLLEIDRIGQNDKDNVSDQRGRVTDIDRLTEKIRHALSLSDAHLKAGDLQKALDFAQQGLKHARETEDQQRLIWPLSRIAALHHFSGLYSESETFFNQALALTIPTDKGSPSLSGQAGFQYLDLLSSMGQNKDLASRFTYLKDIREYFKIGNEDHAWDALTSAKLSLIEPRFDVPTNLSQVRAHFRSLDEARELLSPETMLQFLSLKAQFHQMQQHFDQAEQCLKDALDLAENKKLELFKADLLLELSNLHLTRGNKNTAKEFLESAESLVEKFKYDRHREALVSLRDKLLGKDLQRLESALRASLFKSDYRDARPLFMQFIEEADRVTAHQLKEELGYLFDPDQSDREDFLHIRNFDRSVKRRHWLWRILCEPNRFTPISGLEESIDPLDVEPMIHEPERAMTPSIPIDENRSKETSQEKGEALEDAVLELFEHFFSFDPEEESRLRHDLVELRKQSKGHQFGYDLNLKFNCTLRDNQKVTCKIECKNYKKEKKIMLDHIAGKITMAEETNPNFDHWILISPRSDPTAALGELLEKWQKTQKYPFTVQVWSPATQVHQFFGLVPRLYDLFGQASHGGIHPTEWKPEDRARIYDKWREKLNPPIRLPPAWRDYLKHPVYWSFKWENSRDLEILAGNHVAMKCADAAGNQMEISLSDYVQDWLREEGKPVLFLLGHFGDGKTVFTYILTSNLARIYLEDPMESWLPIRFALKDFYKAGDSGAFIEKRLREFGAGLKEWTQIKQDRRVLLILDGFDEMSTRLDPASIGENIRNLQACCEDLLHERSQNIKILITSRAHFFKNQRDVSLLIQRLHEPEMIYLAPIERREVIHHLDALAEDDTTREMVQAIYRLHDPVGLGSKPLFLNMIKETLSRLANKTDKNLNEIVLYDTYVLEALERKKEQLEDWRDMDRTPLDIEIRDNLLQILEQVALALHRSRDKFVYLSDFEMTFGAHLTGMLWRITEESTVPGDAERDEDARARVGIRSLLSPVQMEDPERKWPVDFCHRSIKEFFVARAIHRALIEDPEKAEKLMAEIRLNHEILDFAAGILHMDEDNDFVQSLTAMARQTSAHAPKSTFLGANAVTLLYRLTGKLEDNDWSKLRLDGADLTGADLSHKNFSGASLRHVQLDNANLAYADFRDCDLTGVRLEETVPVSALTLSPAKRKILAAYGDRSLREWDLSHPSKNRVETKSTDMGMVPDWLEIMGSGGVNASMKNRVAYFDYSDPGTLKQKASFRTPVNLYRFVPEKHALMTLTETREDGFTASTIDFEHGVQLHSYTMRDVHLCVPLGKKGFAFYHEGYGIRIFMEDQASADYAIDTRGVSVLRAKAGREEHRFLLAGGYHDGKVCIWKISHGPKKIEVEPIFEHALHRGTVTTLDFWSGTHVVSGGIDRKILIFNYQKDPENAVERDIHLTINCRGIRIRGVKGEIEHRMLADLRKKAEEG